MSRFCVEVCNWAFGCNSRVGSCMQFLFMLLCETLATVRKYDQFHPRWLGPLLFCKKTKHGISIGISALL